MGGYINTARSSVWSELSVFTRKVVDSNSTGRTNIYINYENKICIYIFLNLKN